jgi:carbamoyl-phosphate synthase large subunit
MRKLGIPQPESGMASTLEEAMAIAGKIGYPLMVRPSFVLGGRAMEVVHDEAMLKRYVKAAVDVSPERPILIDKFLENAIEAEADAIADGTDAFVPAVMEHIEEAGVHSGDSACVIPPITIPAKHIETIIEYTRKIAMELKVVGLMNIQYALYNDTVYILEANPRASRTVPLVSKVCGISMARIATQLMLGKKLKDLDIKVRPIPHYGVKEAVFPFYFYPEVDPVLGPEMKSTGEVLGMAESFGMAFYKAQDAAQSCLPSKGTVLITVADKDKQAVIDIARRFSDLGFKIMSTSGTCKFLAENGIKSEMVNKMHEQRPHIADIVKDGNIQMVINTPRGKTSKVNDAYIRQAAIRHKVPYVTTMAAALAAVKGIEAFKEKPTELKSLQKYHADIN